MKKFSKRDLKRQINGDLPLESKNAKNAEESQLSRADQPAPELRRLDELVFERYPQYSHNALRNAIRNSLVSVESAQQKDDNKNTVETDPTRSFPAETVVSLNLPEKPTPPPPNVIYEDDNVLVINKPAGLLSIVKGDFCFEPSVADYGLIVHRLDRATSGVMILAKNRRTQKLLQRQFNRRTAHKTYYAIVAGVPKAPKAKIDLPITRDLSRPTTFKVAKNGRPAQTYYEVIATKNDRSLLKLQPITGRTHQLRVHLKYLGYPIIGDSVYGDTPKSASASAFDNAPKNAPKTQNTKTAPEATPRLLLHATFLEITIPGKASSAPNESSVQDAAPNDFLTQNAAPNERKTFFAPLPPEFAAEFPYEPDPSRIGAEKDADAEAPDEATGPDPSRIGAEKDSDPEGTAKSPRAPQPTTEASETPGAPR